MRLAGDPALLRRLPPLPRLETLDIKQSSVGDDSLRRLTVLPRLKSIGLKKTLVTCEGLGELATLDSLEEVAIDGDEQCCVSAAGIESLLAVKRLKKLHWGRNSFYGADWWTMMPLDQGREVRVYKRELDRCQQAVQALRESHPGIVIDGKTYALSAAWRDQARPTFEDDGHPIRDAAWLPASGVSWMSASSRAQFEQEEGWASFYGAGRRHKDGHLISVSF